jgi:predicted nucleic acid-binding protein
MKNGLVIADAGPIFSLAVVNELKLLDNLFENVKIPKAVWDEITLDENNLIHDKIVAFFSNRVQKIQGFNELTFIMDYGESESVILYREMQADFLLIDDKKARKIAENFEINCIGTLGLLMIAKDKGLIEELKPIFASFIVNKRFYSIDLLNVILEQKNETPLSY